MDQLHLHLIITHLPIFGSILGAFVLGYALLTKSHHTKKAAYFLTLFSSLGACVSYATGEAAEEAVEKIPGVAESLIGQHESAAVYTLFALIGLGLLALIGLGLSYSKSKYSKSVATITLLVSLVSFGLVAWTGYLGGKIRHTEINPGNLNSPSNNHEKEEKESE